MKYLSISKAALPLAIVAGLGMAPAQAADLGGDCCADLEERIAELEATTVRKGNRRVSLKLSGHVNTGVIWWDNGSESNVYVADNGNSSTRFRLTGSAKISSDVSAHFFIELGIYDARTPDLDENNDDGNTRVAVRKQWWALKSKTLGMLTVGRQDMATADIAAISLGGTGSVGYFHNNSIFTRYALIDAAGADTGVNWGAIVYGNNNGTFQGDIVRYDSPTIMGFKVSAAWGEDDEWDVALRFAQEFGDFRVAAGVGYGVELEFGGTGQTDEVTIGASASVMHVSTGLWVSGGYTEREQNFTTLNSLSRESWAASGGITQKFTPIGKTTLFGEYNVSTGYRNRATGMRNEGTIWGAGLIQHIDAAAMQLYVGYRNYSADLHDGATGAVIATQDAQTILAGGKIAF